MVSARTPRYLHLKQQIIARISAGELKPRDRVPSENDLVTSFGVSRMTANRALRELNDEGYVERVAGVGTFVADLRAASHVLEVRNIAEEIAHRGHRHSASVLRLSRQHARGAIARSLQLTQGDDVFHVLLVHRENDSPVQLEDRYVAADFAPHFLEQDFTVLTPSAYLSAIAPLQEAEQVVRAAMPNKAVRDHLDMPEREPCLVVVRRTWAHGQAVSFGRLHHPGSRFELAGHYTPPGTERGKTLNEQPGNAL
ncbi:MAG: histidine utilization repressor [Woeseia sp.]|nr:histidine utilization repressor [Woeseia sp.]MBT8097854.1 histidine utilization repressor [Woeseia sp.]NNE60290.1 histidine utilization repressor [Woeseia sp.]NNL55976.1 histidine utilization repressor [Woeseia sp.]